MHKKLRHQLILLKEIDRKFLQPERTRGNTDHTQPKMIVSDAPCLHNFMITSMEKKKLRHHLTISRDNDDKEFSNWIGLQYTPPKVLVSDTTL